jgi:hypothetical protein
MAGYTPGASLGGIQATLGSVTLGQVDGAGVAWGLGDIQGWDSPDVRTTYQDRQADHGAWAGPSYLQARVLTLTGTITADAAASLDTAQEQLRAAASLTDTTLTVYENVPKQATVRRSGRVLISRITDRIASYSLLLTAADPRRYSTTLQSQSTALPSVTGGLTLPITMPITISATTASGTISLAIAGSIATRPVLTITGPAPSPTILAQRPDGTVTQQTYSDTLLAGDVLTIDCAAKTVILNGQVSRRLYLSGTWPEIPPASQLTISWSALAYDPAALLTGTCRSAWM